MVTAMPDELLVEESVQVVLVTSPNFLVISQQGPQGPKGDPGSGGGGAQESYIQLIGNNSTHSFVITHNLNSMDVDVTLIYMPTGEVVTADLDITGLNTILVEFGVTIPLNGIKVIIEKVG